VTDYERQIVLEQAASRRAPKILEPGTSDRYWSCERLEILAPAASNRRYWSLQVTDTGTASNRYWNLQATDTEAYEPQILAFWATDTGTARSAGATAPTATEPQEQQPLESIER